LGGCVPQKKKIPKKRDPESVLLGAQDIDHTRIKAKRPHTNGILLKSYKTILQEFYQIAFRIESEKSLGQLQTDGDLRIESQNQIRCCGGVVCYGVP